MLEKPKSTVRFWLRGKRMPHRQDLVTLCARLNIDLEAFFGLSLPRITQDQFRCGKAVSLNELRAGDLVFFIALSQHVIDHVVIYLGDWTKTAAMAA